MPAPFGTIAPADAMRGAVELAVEMTAAQRHVVRSIMTIRAGIALTGQRTFKKNGLHAAVARELVLAGFAKVEEVTRRSTTFRLTHHAMQAALEPGESLPPQCLLPRDFGVGGHPSNEF